MNNNVSAVDFITAIKGNKRIKLESQWLHHDSKLKEFNTLDNQLYELSCELPNEFIIDVILKGQWFIEE